MVIFVSTLMLFVFLGHYNHVNAACNATVSNSCAFNYTTDGIDEGGGSSNSSNLTIQNGGTVTVAFNQTIAVGKLTLSGGAVVIIDGGQILLGTPLWVPDSDGDGYPDEAALTASNSAPGGHYIRRSTSQDISTPDCDPYNINVKPGQTNFYATAIVDVGGTSAKNGTFDYDCDGVATKENTSAAAYACNQTSCDAHHYTVTTGWADGSNPACGTTENFRTRTVAGTCASTSCSYTTTAVTQRCR